MLCFVAGLVLLHLYLSATSLVGLRWSRLVVTLPFLVLAALAVVRRRRTDRALRTSPNGPTGKRTARSDPGWLSFARANGGDVVAVLSLLVLAVLALLRRIAASDFIYHWGLKGEKYALAGGIDTSFLAAPWNRYVHPDYPNLVPELFASTALLEGGFREGTALLWSVLATALLFVAARRLAYRTFSLPTDAQLTLAALALAVTSFSVSWQMTGNADIWIALAVLLAAAALAGSPGSDLEAGVAAALAAAVKIEGLVFAALVVTLHLGRRLARRELRTGGLLRTLVPPLLVVAAWAAPVSMYGLGQDYASLEVEPGRVLAMLRTLLDSLAHDGWHGLSLVAVALVLLLPLFRRYRVAALLLVGQLAFYLTAYVTTSRDMEYLIRTTAPRLVLHLLPAALVLGAALLMAGGTQTDERARSGKKRG